MNGTPTLHPCPASPRPPPDEYERPSEGCTPPRAFGSAKGTLNVAMPVESRAEKLSPMPWIEPEPLGTEMACDVTPDLSAPPGKDSGSMFAVGSDGASPVSSAGLGVDDVSSSSAFCEPVF